MLPQLQAETQLRAIEAASLPHMKDDGRQKVFSRLRAATGGPVQARSAVEALTQAGIPIVKVAKKATSSPTRGGTRRDKTKGGGEPSQ